MGRLTKSTAGNQLGEEIEYDVMGNIKKMIRDHFGTNNYTYQSGNQLSAVNGFTNSTYTYDLNGSLKTDDLKGLTFNYTFLNLPQSVVGSQNLIKPILHPAQKSENRMDL